METLQIAVLDFTFMQAAQL